jgi:hypothetical protein
MTTLRIAYCQLAIAGEAMLKKLAIGNWQSAIRLVAPLA